MFTRVFLAAVPALALCLAGCGLTKPTANNNKPEPKAAPKAEPKAAPKAEPKPVTQAEPKAAPKAEPKPVTQSAPKPEPKSAPKAEPKDDSPVLAVVDGEKITRTDLETSLTNVTRGRPVPPEDRAEVERSVLDMLISQKLLKKFIATQEVELDPDMLFNIKLTSYLQNLGPKPAEADKLALEKARAMKKQIDAGKDFAELARQNSSCPSGERSGGDLGEFLPNDPNPSRRMDATFTAAVKALAVNAVSEPVKTPFGYHVIQRLPLKNAADPENDKLHARHILIPVEDARSDETMKRNFKKLVEGLRAKAKIENRLPSPPPPVAAPPGAPPPGLKADPFDD